jgi:AraC-like DNA-binding protein
VARFDPNSAPDPDAVPLPVLGMAIDAQAPHDSGEHCHQRAQLLYAVGGVMDVQIGRLRCVLPPMQAAWIPSGLPHTVRASKPFAYRSLYLDPEAFAGQLPERAQVLAVSPLLRELMIVAVEWPLAPLDELQQRLLAVLLDQLREAPEQPLSLVMPGDRRLLQLFQQLQEVPARGLALGTWVPTLGLTLRNANRLCRQQTGMTLSVWCQQLRLMEASRLLAEGEPVARVAEHLGYAQESAFIAMFRRATGVAPGRSLRLLKSQYRPEAP